MPPRPRRVLRVGSRLCAAAAVVIAACLAYRYHGPAPAIEIYRGITYGCDRLPDTADGGGLVHWVRADLSVPGVHLYVTPIDPEARAGGWEYRLRHVSTTVADERLAAAVNGTLFDSDSRLARLPGDLARSSETVVADGVPNHVDPNTYLLWWDRAGVAHQEMAKPPSPAVLAAAKWGIGGQENVVVDGRVAPWVGPGSTDWRTAIGADPARHLVWIACFDRASYRSAGLVMVRLGATIGTLVDGGTSSAMALGRDARGVRPGTVTGNWRPVATQFGFRADPLP
jgi:hypothetical protein